jgi:2-amino-4-hydroxy-6-hydroxymethyldihydropteridine diphosphokinase
MAPVRATACSASAGSDRRERATASAPRSPALPESRPVELRHRVAIALGSNVGDRYAHLRFAVEHLSEGLAALRLSTFRETEPVDVPGPQPLYLNAVAVGESPLDPEGLMDALLAIEHARGRSRPSDRAPRTLDLDLILFDDRVIATSRLTVPHPRFRERRFVLEPLAELAPEWVDPVTGKTVGELWTSLKRPRG